MDGREDGWWVDWVGWWGGREGPLGMGGTRDGVGTAGVHGAPGSLLTSAACVMDAPGRAVPVTVPPPVFQGNPLSLDGELLGGKGGGFRISGGAIVQLEGCLASRCDASVRLAALGLLHSVFWGARVFRACAEFTATFAFTGQGRFPLRLRRGGTDATEQRVELCRPQGIQVASSKQ